MASAPYPQGCCQHDHDGGADVDEEDADVGGAAPVLSVGLRLCRVDGAELDERSADEIQPERQEKSEPKPSSCLLSAGATARRPGHQSLTGARRCTASRVQRANGNQQASSTPRATARTGLKGGHRMLTVMWR